MEMEVLCQNWRVAIVLTFEGEGEGERKVDPNVMV